MATQAHALARSGRTWCRRCRRFWRGCSQSTRELTIWFVSATMLTLVFFAVLFFFGDHGPSFPVIEGGEDSEEYIILAEHLLEGRGFTLSNVPPHVPESFRVPGYPLFIAPILALFGSPIAIIFFHGLLVGGIVVLTYLIARLWFAVGVARIAAVLTMVNVSLLFHASIIASEVLFIFLMLLALYLWLRLHDMPSVPWKLPLAVGVLLGFVILTRVVGMLLPVAFILLSVVLVVARAPRLPAFRPVALTWVLLLVGCSAIAGPWLVRNVVVYEQASLSSTGTIGMWYFNIPQAMADVRGISVEQARSEFIPPELQRGMVRTNGPQFPLRQLDAAPILNDEIHAYLDGNLGEYVQGHLTRSAVLLFVDSTRDTAAMLGVPMVGHNVLPADMTPHIRAGDVPGAVHAAWDHVRSGDWENILALLSFGFWVVLYGAVAVAVVTLFRLLPVGTALGIVACCLGMIAYFVLLTGPLAFARTRLPVEPFLFILGAYGLYSIGSYIRTNTYKTSRFERIVHSVRRRVRRT